MPRTRAVVVLGLIVLTPLLMSPSILAQSCTSAGGECGPGGGRGSLRTPLPDGGSVIFDPNGPFAITRPGFADTGSAGAGVLTTSPRPTSNPSINLAPS